MASVTIDAAPRPDPALPARSLIPAMTGAAFRVEIVVTSGESPNRRTCRLAIFVCPNDAPCLAWPYTGRSSESMSTNASSLIPASTLVRPVSATRCRLKTAPSCRA